MDVNPFTAMMPLENDQYNWPNLKPLSLFVFFLLLFFFFAPACDSILIETHSIETRDVRIGPEDLLYAGACVQFSARKFYTPGQ